MRVAPENSVEYLVNIFEELRAALLPPDQTGLQLAVLDQRVTVRLNGMVVVCPSFA